MEPIEDAYSKAVGCSGRLVTSTEGFFIIVEVSNLLREVEVLL
jgi:hypothetical protein